MGSSVGLGRAFRRAKRGIISTRRADDRVETVGPSPNPKRQSSFPWTHARKMGRGRCAHTPAVVKDINHHVWGVLRVPASWREVFLYVCGACSTLDHTRDFSPAPLRPPRSRSDGLAARRPWLLGWCLRRGRPVARGLEPRAASQQDARAHNWGAQHRHGPPAHLQDQDTSCPTLPRARWGLDGGALRAHIHLHTVHTTTAPPH